MINLGPTHLRKKEEQSDLLVHDFSERLVSWQHHGTVDCGMHFAEWFQTKLVVQHQSRHFSCALKGASNQEEASDC